jgi:hypothetical protein
MRSRIQKTVYEDGRTEMSLTHVPATPAEIIEYLRECACVDDRGIRRLPNWLDDEVFDGAADLIYRLVADNGWRPIKTAPMDGSHILATNGKETAVVHWFDNGWQLSVNQQGEYSEWIWADLTRWMPVPAA